MEWKNEQFLVNDVQVLLLYLQNVYLIRRVSAFRRTEASLARELSIYLFLF